MQAFQTYMSVEISTIFQASTVTADLHSLTWRDIKKLNKLNRFQNSNLKHACGETSIYVENNSDMLKSH